MSARQAVSSLAFPATILSRRTVSSLTLPSLGEDEGIVLRDISVITAEMAGKSGTLLRAYHLG